MSSILRLSALCSEPFDLQRIQIKVLDTTIYDESVLHCPTTALVTLDFLRRVSVREGTLVWIRRIINQAQATGPTSNDEDDNDDEDSSNINQHSSVVEHGTQPQVAVRLLLLNQKVMNKNKIKEDGAHKSTIWIHPLAAINIGLIPPHCYPNKNQFREIDAWIMGPLVHDIPNLPIAHQVTLRQWGRPLEVPSLVVNSRNHNGTTNNSMMNPPWPKHMCLLQPGKLVAVVHDLTTDTSTKNRTTASMSSTSYYQVVEVITDDEEVSTLSSELDRYTSYQFSTYASKHYAPRVYRSNCNTAYRVETLARPWTCPPLPSAIMTRPTRLAPHPNVPELVEAMQLPAHVTPSQRILTVEGSPSEHDVECAIRTASAWSGRQCLVVQGLAAHAHRCSGLTRSASLVDKLAGLRLAVDQAYRAAPSVLMLVDFDQELTWQDERLCHDEQSRFWSLLTSSSCSKPDDGSNVPSVITILSMAQMPTKGPLVEHLIWEPLHLDRPDSAFAEFLWSQTKHAPTVDDLWSLLQGRTADEIVQLAQQVADDYSTTAKGRKDEVQDSSRRLLQRRLEEHNKHGQSSSSTMTLIPQVKWSDVGGLDHVRNEILETIELPLRHSHLFSSSSGRSGVLLYGPPGTGKTLVAKAVANECRLPFLSIKGPELLGTYVGESEANVRTVFAQARDLAQRSIPHHAAILFFDELDSLAPRRADGGGAAGGGGASVMDRVVATLFAELDRPKQDCTIYCIGATNRPDMLDPALLRPGRLDRTVYLGLSDVDRRQILEVHLSKLKLRQDDDAPTMVERILEHIATKALSGADLAAVATSALLFATQRLCDQAEAESWERNLSVEEVLSQWSREQLEPVVELDDLLKGAEDVAPGVDDSELARYEEIRKHMESNR